jgi:2-desacetyl-2-hydroxyethyl bacteriochlorophyllide A dehydrogenase
MSEVVVFAGTQQLGFEHEKDEKLAAREVRIQTLYSGISAGTELTAYRGSNPYLRKQWDTTQRLFVPSETTTLRYPVVGWGYEECGEVVEVGKDVAKVKTGDVIYGTWGHRTHTIVSEEYAVERVLPADLHPILGVFSQIGAIALNGAHDAAIRIGETVAIFGLGTPGQIMAQLAKRSGATVIGIDLHPVRRQMALDLCSVDAVLDPRLGGVAEQIRAMTNLRGADVCIEVSGAYTALHEAIRSAAYSARVVTLGFFQNDGQGLFLGEEFHHNRINVVCSQIYGVSPELTYRWNQARLIATGMRLQAQGVLNLRPIITHVVPFRDAAEAFRLVDKEPERAVQVVLDFSN